jgi:hypothetical protein
MKTLIKIIVLLALAFCSNSCFGGASYAFHNYSTYFALDAPVFDAAGNRLEGTNYVAMLYGGRIADSLAPAWRMGVYPMAPVPFTDYSNSGQAGYFNSPGWVEVMTVGGSGTAWLQVRAWDSRLGRTYEEVVSLGLGGYGESNPFQAQGGSSGGQPAFPAPLIGLQSFSLLPVIPEPSSIILFIFGLAFMLYRSCHSQRRHGL